MAGTLYKSNIIECKYGINVVLICYLTLNITFMLIDILIMNRYLIYRY